MHRRVVIVQNSVDRVMEGWRFAGELAALADRLIWLGQAKDDAMMLMMHGMRLSWALKRTGDLAAAPG